MTYKILFKGTKDINMYIQADDEQEARFEALARLERRSYHTFQGFGTQSLEVIGSYPNNRLDLDCA